MPIDYPLNIPAVAPGLQAVKVSLPFPLDEEQIGEVMLLVSPLLRQQSVGHMIHLQSHGTAIEEVLESLRRLIAET
jgi:hypothetical protein